MYAIVEIAGQQYKVEKDQQIYVHHLGAEEGKSLTFEKVLLVDDNGKISVGAPAVSGASVTAKVVTPLVKGDKVLIFKKKRRKGYQKLNGHRQQFTQVQIEGISLK